MTSPTAIYKLGPSFNLVTLPGIPWGLPVESDREAPAAINTTLGGRRIRDVLGPVKRSWRFQWTYLSTAEMQSIENIIDGKLGLPLMLDEPFESVPPIEVILESYSRSFITPTEVNVNLSLLEV